MAPSQPPAVLRRGPGRMAGAAILNALALVLTTLLYVLAATLVALLLVRVGADLLQGIDPLASEARRPRLYPQQLALRELASDLVRQALLAVLVIGVVIARDGAAWRRTLALARPAAGAGSPPALSLLWIVAILSVWPVIHILWVAGTSEVFHAPFGRNVRISPMLSPGAVAAWIAYVGLFAPVAEELLMRGEIFAKARGFLRPWGAVLVTAALFALLHLQIGSVARPVSLIPLALMLGWLRWRTGLLWPCILLHGWSNLAVVAYQLWPDAV